MSTLYYYPVFHLGTYRSDLGTYRSEIITYSETTVQYFYLVIRMT
jgi:hypothetical protein